MGQLENIFIIGFPRSGTSLLESIIAHHPEIVSNKVESRFYSDYHGKYGDLSRDKNLDCLYKDFSQTKFFKRLDLDEQELIKTLKSHKISYKNFFKFVMEGYCNKNEGKYWVEKTPAHIHYINLIISDYPNTKIINITRNPFDVITSILKLSRDGTMDWGWSCDHIRNSSDKNITGICILDDIQHWLSTVHYSKNQEKKIDQKTLLNITYEDLILNTDQLLEKISGFLGLNLQLDLDEKPLSTANSSFKDRKDGIYKISVGTYKKYLQADEINLIEFFVNPTLRLLNYSHKFIVFPRLSVIRTILWYAWKDKNKFVHLIKLYIKSQVKFISHFFKAYH